MKLIIYVLTLPIEQFVKLISFSEATGGDSGGGKTNSFAHLLCVYQGPSDLTSLASEDFKASLS